MAPSSTEKCGIGLTANVDTVDAKGGEGRLTVSTGRECAWTVTSSVPWITIKPPAQGQGDGSVGFAVAPNGEPAPRHGALAVGDWQVSITQRAAACEFALSIGSATVPAAGGARDVDVRASGSTCEWTAASAADWITITKGASGRGSGRVTFAVAATSGPPRSGALTIADRTITVTQADGCSYTVTPSSVSVAAARVSSTLAVAASAGCPWSAATTAAWISVGRGATGAGSGEVVLDIAANDGPERSASVTIADRPITVRQASGCSFAVSPASLSVPATQGSPAVTVTAAAGCSWSAASTASWITVARGASGAGPGEVVLDVAANDGPARSATVTVANRSVSVAQASGCRFQVSPTTLAFIYQGQSLPVTVSTSPVCGWTAATGADWLAVSPGSGSGPGTVNVTAERNSGPKRDGTLTIAGQTVSASQLSGCHITFSEPGASFGPGGGKRKFRVTTGDGCRWQAKVVGGSWVQITRGDDGNGSGPVEYTVAPNPGAARLAEIVIENRVYWIAQAGS